ncbi:hypothetical protein GCM10011506_22620 [Marivirga lumbricoides]|uniref:DUF4270 domain-containing protein n=1 Tax=Marivirga lumbricoides TaxID=1046115 RepID=A0ABQ1MB16_9BACT|nr:hypothetical protein GCM10011506_22620 [Marivirga lumbricoides]
MVPGGNNTDLRFVEFDLPVKHSAFDSVIVSSNNVSGSVGRVYIGHYNDPQIGQIDASGYFGVSLTNSTTERNNIDATSQLVRARLYMNFNYFYGDEFTAPQTFVLSQLADTIEAKNYTVNDDIPVSGNGKVSVDTSFVVRPTDTLTHYIPLTASFGNTMFNAVKNDDLTNLEVAQLLKGFKIQAEGDVNNIMGLNIASGESYFELVFTDEDTVSSVTFNLTGASFTNVDYQPGALIPSDYSGNKSFDLTNPEKIFFNSFLGIFPRFDFQQYLSFIDTVDFMLINKAELVIQDETLQTENSVTVQKSPPSILVPYIVGDEDRILKISEDFWAIQANFSSSGGIANQQVASSPTNLTYVADDNRIVADISFFLQEIYDTPTFWDSGNDIILTGQFIRRNPTPFVDTPIISAGSFNNLLVDKGDVKLKVYYTTFK